MEITIQPRGELTFNIDINHVIDEINELSIMQRWELIAKILNKIILTDIGYMDNEHKAIIIDFLTNNLNILSKKRDQ